jgi:hypothetical protein
MDGNLDFAQQVSEQLALLASLKAAVGALKTADITAEFATLTKGVKVDLPQEPCVTLIGLTLARKAVLALPVEPQKQGLMWEVNTTLSEVLHASGGGDPQELLDALGHLELVANDQRGVNLLVATQLPFGQPSVADHGEFWQLTAKFSAMGGTILKITITK